MLWKVDGEIQWGSAVDDGRIFAAIGHVGAGVPCQLPSGETITGGSWAALDQQTGRIIWQVADPLGAPDLGALTAANGVRSVLRVRRKWKVISDVGRPYFFPNSFNGGRVRLRSPFR